MLRTVGLLGLVLTMFVLHATYDGNASLSDVHVNFDELEQQEGSTWSKSWVERDLANGILTAYCTKTNYTGVTRFALQSNLHGEFLQIKVIFTAPGGTVINMTGVCPAPKVNLWDAIEQELSSTESTDSDGSSEPSDNEPLLG